MFQMSKVGENETMKKDDFGRGLEGRLEGDTNTSSGVADSRTSPVS